ncbi:MAG TPA: YibE/F family protein [Anaerovoracaceae bacterium]|nr:YibE/F family protein [Anaerovoracaceae bacterium]
MKIKKKSILKLSALIILSITVYFLFYNNFSLYKDTIAKVDSVKHYDITATIVNGEDKGNKIELTNKYEDSLVYDEKYNEGNYLFVSYSLVSDSWSIMGMKRDYIIALVLIILFDLLIIIGFKQGFYTIIGLCINITIFSLSMFFYTKGTNILILSIFMVIIFSCLILYLINGHNKNTLLSIFSTLASVTLIATISSIIMFFAPNISYDFMEFMPQPHSTMDANLLLISEILIGGLGVIMDISVTITTCATELIEKNSNISKKDLVKSCKEVADDITGTMINVVLLTNIAAFMPIFILAVNNEFRITTIIKNNMYFETIRFLTGSMGIIIAIPLSILVVSKFSRRLEIK